MLIYIYFHYKNLGHNDIKSFFGTKTTSVIGTKTMKAKGFPRYIKFKINYGKVSLNIVLNTKHKNQDKNMKYAKQKFELNIILITHENNEHEMKRIRFVRRIFSFLIIICN